MDTDATAALAYAQKLRQRLISRVRDVERQGDYFLGKQPLAYASDEWSSVHKARYANFSDNWCGVVGSAPAERLELRGIRLDGDASVSDVERKLWRDFEVCAGPELMAQGFLTSTISKRSFALVWGDSDGSPRLSWESPSQMLVDFDLETGEYAAAIKCWSDGDHEYLTLYTADYVWKWERPEVYNRANTPDGEKRLVLPPSMTDDYGWEARQGTDATWPLRNPIGTVPVAEFANRPMLGGEPISDIDGTIAMQDAVNLLWAYLFVAADYASMPARVVLGQEPPKMPKLNEKGEVVGELPVDQEALKRGRMLWLTGQATKIDQWAPSQLDVFTDVINIAIRHIATQSSTPIYLIHGEMGNINGETLAGLDAPLVSKVGYAQKHYRQPVRRLFELLARVRGNRDVALAARSAMTLWKDAATHSPVQQADAAIKARQIGMPLAEVLRRYFDYTEPEITAIVQEARDEATDPYLRSLSDKDASDESESVEA